MKNVIKKTSSVALLLFTIGCLYFAVQGKVGIMAAYGLIVFNSIRVVIEIIASKTIIKKLNIPESIKEEIPRKVGHMLISFITYPMAYFSFKGTIHLPICAGVFTLVFFILSNIGLMSMLDRGEDKNNNIHAVAYLIGGMFITSVISYFNPEFLVPGALGVMVVGLGDPMACIIGRNFGKHKFKNGKTVEGFIGFIIGATIAMYIFSHIVIWKLLIIAIVGAIVELFSGDYDNLLIQTISAITALFII